MTNKYLLALLPFIIFLNSCKKEDDEATDLSPVAEIIDYTPYKTGNYWIYERYRVDSSGAETPLGVYDSCYVSGDTILNGNQYFILVKPSFFSVSEERIFIRDSLDYLVTSTGEILFSSSDFNTVFSSVYVTAGVGDTVAAIQVKMENKDVSYTVPALTCITSDMVTRYSFYPAWSMNGSLRLLHHRYGRNVGEVTETLSLFANNPSYTERKLIRYHLN